MVLAVEGIVETISSVSYLVSDVRAKRTLGVQATAVASEALQLDPIAEECQEILESRAAVLYTKISQ